MSKLTDIEKEFIEFTEKETGFSYGEFRLWRLGSCLEVIEKFIIHKRK